MPGCVSGGSDWVGVVWVDLNIFMFLKFSQEFWSAAKDVTTVIDIYQHLTNGIRKEWGCYNLLLFLPNIMGTVSHMLLGYFISTCIQQTFIQYM